MSDNRYELELTLATPSRALVAEAATARLVYQLADKGEACVCAIPTSDMDHATIAVSPCLPANRNRREEADDYRAIVAKLNPRWRVIECRDAIQWILQGRAGARHGQPRWDGRRYCRTRQGLMRNVRALAGECDAIALATLERLPEWVEVRQ